MTECALLYKTHCPFTSKRWLSLSGQTVAIARITGECPHANSRHTISACCD